jgi:hypothetical protein
MERGIQRSGLNLEDIFRRLLDVFGDGVAMRWSPLQRSKNENVERTLEKFDSLP